MKNKSLFVALLFICLMFCECGILFPYVSAEADIATETASTSASSEERTVVANGKYGNPRWTVYSDGELVISGSGKLTKSPESIPWSDYSSQITTVTIGKNITYLPDGFFSANKITSIYVEEGNQYYSSNEDGVLFNYDKTELLQFPKGCGKTEYVIPNGVKYVIGFGNYSKLESITFPETLISIGTRAFSACTNLKNFQFPEGLESIGLSAFHHCYSLTELKIPASVSFVDEMAFCDCTALAQVSFDNGRLAVIPELAFYGCSQLESITLPNGLTEIGASAFNACSKLKSIDLPSSLVKIDGGAFSGASALEEIVFPDSLQSIGSRSFLECISLKEIVIPDRVETIGTAAFQNCTALARLEAGNGLRNIDSDAFNGCKMLSEISLSDNITDIGDEAFEETAYFNDKGNWDNGFLYIKKYLIKANNAEIDKECRVYSKTVLIADNAFESTSITSIYIPDSVKYIGSKAFYFCRSLEKVKLPINLTKISFSTFYYCSRLTSIDIPEGVTEIDSNAFRLCSSLSEITVPDSVNVIGDYAFDGCTSLLEFDIPDSLKTIGTYAFSKTGISKVSIPSTVTTIGKKAFSDTALSEIHYGASKRNWKRINKELDSEEFPDATIYYTLYADNVILKYCDDDVSWEAGNVEIENIVSESVAPEDSYFIKGEFYVDSMMEPISIMNIRMLDGDGNKIQLLEGRTVSVYIKAPDKVAEMFKNGIDRYYGTEKNIDFSSISLQDDNVIFDDGGASVSIPVSDLFKNSLNIYHWFSEKYQDKNFMVYKSCDIIIENGYINIEVPHFSEFTICTESINLKESEFELENGDSVSLSVSVTDGIKVIYSSSDENVATVDENGVVTAVGAGTATITATINGTNISDFCTITVPANDYTIKWIVDGVATEQTVTEESIITKPENPEKEGYTFIGWTPEVPDTMPAENLEFTAVWQINKYTITFDTAGGTAIAPITLECGATITSPVPPAKDGFVFIRWAPELPETMPANDLTVVAEYEEVETPDVPENPNVTVTGIKIISIPNKTQYIYKADSLDLSGLVIKMMYSDGTSKIISDTKTVNAYGFNADSVGTKTVTVAYGGYTDEFEITVSYAWWQWIIRILLLGFIWY